MKTYHALLAALLACTLSPALAVDAPDAVAPDAPAAHGPTRRGEDPRLPARAGAAVKNAPYSARIVTERLQPLADGNQIERRASAASYRDSAGRTRHEVRDDKGELRAVTIKDPVANATWLLRPDARTAHRLPSMPDLARFAQLARARVEQLRKEGRLPPPARGDGSEGRAVIRIEREREAQRDGQHERGSGGEGDTVRVIRLPRMAGIYPGIPAGADLRALAPQLAQLGPMIAGAAADAKWAAKASSRDLGTRSFDGVKAEGKLRSYEIPAGEVGNRNPIVVSDESWYAPELQVTVYAKHSDPRSGEAIYRLEGIKRGEPDAALFAVPADYEVKERPRAPGRHRE